MFDCPLHNHTSPTRMSRITTVSDPATVIDAGVLMYGSGSSLAIHFPFVATADTVCPANVTVTRSPSPARPHTGTATPCCSTM